MSIFVKLFKKLFVIFVLFLAPVMAQGDSWLHDVVDEELIPRDNKIQFPSQAFSSGERTVGTPLDLSVFSQTFPKPLYPEARLNFIRANLLPEFYISALNESLDALKQPSLTSGEIAGLAYILLKNDVASNQPLNHWFRGEAPKSFWHELLKIHALYAKGSEWALHDPESLKELSWFAKNSNSKGILGELFYLYKSYKKLFASLTGTSIPSLGAFAAFQSSLSLSLIPLRGFLQNHPSSVLRNVESKRVPAGLLFTSVFAILYGKSLISVDCQSIKEGFYRNAFEAQKVFLPLVALFELANTISRYVPKKIRQADPALSNLEALVAELSNLLVRSEKLVLDFEKAQARSNGGNYSRLARDFYKLFSKFDESKLSALFSNGLEVLVRCLVANLGNDQWSFIDVAPGNEIHFTGLNSPLLPKQQVKNDFHRRKNIQVATFLGTPGSGKSVFMSEILTSLHAANLFSVAPVEKGVAPQVSDFLQITKISETLGQVPSLLNAEDQYLGGVSFFQQQLKLMVESLKDIVKKDNLPVVISLDEPLTSTNPSATQAIVPAYLEMVQEGSRGTALQFLTTHNIDPSLFNGQMAFWETSHKRQAINLSVPTRLFSPVEKPSWGIIRSMANPEAYKTIEVMDIFADQLERGPSKQSSDDMRLLSKKSREKLNLLPYAN
jgi:hypothetical protein